MQINSNTIHLDKESYEKLESIVSKIAEENNVKNIDSIHIALTENNGIVRFKQAEDPAQDPNAVPPADPNAAAPVDPNAQQAPVDPNAAAAVDPNAQQAPADPNAAPQDPNQMQAGEQAPAEGQQPAAAVSPEEVAKSLLAAYNQGGDAAVAAAIKQQEPNTPDDAVNNAVAQIKQMAEQLKQQQAQQPTQQA